MHAGTNHHTMPTDYMHTDCRTQQFCRSQTDTNRVPVNQVSHFVFHLNMPRYNTPMFGKNTPLDL